MNEINHQTLQTAILHLPFYEPNANVWTNIELELNNDEALEQAMEQLPSYSPPAEVWERISEELEKPATIFRLRPIWISYAAAVAAVLIIGAYWWSLQYPTPIEKVNMVYQEVEKPKTKLVADWDEDEAAIMLVVNAYEKRTSIFQTDKSLLSELEELNQAKAEVKTMLKKYGTDPDLIKSIAEIERQRSTIIKQMVTAI